MKARAKAHPNIALVKYWGKADERLRLPFNSSLSITINGLYTETEVEFSNKLNQDKIKLIGGSFSEKETERVVEHLNRIRQMAGVDSKAEVVTKNTFKKAAGMASSASGFAALSLAGSKAAGLDLTEKELSILARLGSGSACRSVLGGIVVWEKGNGNESSYARKIDFEDKWGLRVLLVKIDWAGEKKVGSTKGMGLVKTSPYWKMAVEEGERNVVKMKRVLLSSDWEEFGRLIEVECFRLHELCITSNPSLNYWLPATLRVFASVYELRNMGIKVFFTTDAGPHVHVVCKKRDEEKAVKELKKIIGVKEVISCGIGRGARLFA